MHLAWLTEPPRYWTSPDNLRWVEASLRLADAFARHGGRRLVVAGSCAEYDWTGTTACHETATPLTPATFYGAAKHALRTLLDPWSAAAGLSFGWGRVFFAYGPGERPERLVPSVIRALRAGERVALTDGTQARDFLHVDDVGAAFAALVASDVRGAVNIASGTPVTLRDLVTRIATRLDGESRLDFGALPQRPGEPPRLFADVTRLVHEVGFRPRFTLDEGLAQTLAARD